MPLERVSKSFKDVSIGFKINPLTRDLIGIKNETAIARSVRNIVLTLPGEKFFDPNFGTNISQTLFENVDEVSSSIIEDQISASILTYEPRIDSLKVEVLPDPDNLQFGVRIQYRIIGIDVPIQSLSFALQPTR